MFDCEFTLVDCSRHVVCQCQRIGRRTSFSIQKLMLIFHEVMERRV